MTTKIEKLTPEQEAKISEYVDKYIAIGLSTDRIDPKEANKIAKYCYEKILDSKCPKVEIYPSPMAAWKAILKRQYIQENNIPKNNQQDIENTDAFKEFARNTQFVSPYISGSFESGYFAFYDFMFDELKIHNNVKEKYDWYRSTLKIGLFYPLDDVCIISEKPSMIKMKDGKLHCDGGPAIQYSDGFSVWSLNGVRVDQYLAETRSEEIDPKKIVEYTNVEQRREFVRKVGLERIKYKLGAKVLDERTLKIDGKNLPYKVIAMKIADTTYTALEMENASIPDVYHVEFVPNNCNTFQKAWRFRVGLDDDSIDNKNGSDWYLHGDVVIKPKDATKFKEFPTWIA